MASSRGVQAASGDNVATLQPPQLQDALNHELTPRTCTCSSKIEVSIAIFGWQ
jgi:hypothetical protein